MFSRYFCCNNPNRTNTPLNGADHVGSFNFVRNLDLIDKPVREPGGWRATEKVYGLAAFVCTWQQKPLLL
ncbi:MAG: hypothetical protein HFE73_00505 [Firmicutes bacterium]|nr:hypothetical protein [Bacillota bacterium]